MSEPIIKSSFLKQSFLDSIDEYNRSLKNETYRGWDSIVISASNDIQADGYIKQIEYRKTIGLIPKNCEILVIADKDNKRIGSAGSTLSIIKELKEKYNNFDSKKFLVIHAGGDSKRCPQYSALGKLFSPVPLEINNHPACLFDIFLITMANMPSRMKEGMLLLSGDVMLLFNALMCDFGSNDAAVVSFKEDVNTATNHGVYLESDNGFVSKFLHKQSIDNLKKLNAIDDKGNCNIDTGIIYLGINILNDLYSLIDNDDKYNSLVNDKTRLSLYGDISYCLALDSTIDDYYLEKAEGEYCDELKQARTTLFNAINKYTCKLIAISPAKFIHFGSVKEIVNLMNNDVHDYEPLGFKSQVFSSINNDNVSSYSSILSLKADVKDNVYLESSYVHGNSKIGNNCYISYMDIDDATIDDNLLVHGLKLNNGKYVCRIININDNPKDNSIYELNIDELINKYHLTNVFDDNDHSLWNAKLFKECENMKDALKSSINLYKYLTGKTNNYDFDNNRQSLCSSFNEADCNYIIDWNNNLLDLIKMDKLDRLIKHNMPVTNTIGLFKTNKLSKTQLDWIDLALSKLDYDNLDDFSYGMRLYYYLGYALNNDEYIAKCFKLICDVTLKSTINNLSYNDKCVIKHNETTVKLPLRVNFGGGWSDTYPHCLEQGGKVINAAINLNGQLPVEVKLVKINEHKIVFDSRDTEVHGEFIDIEELQKVGDPSDPFVLQKACLLACGIIPKEGSSLTDVLERLSGGFEMHSEVRNVPKGSGLGTSSILAAASVQAIFDFMDIEYDKQKLYSTVLAVEQLMSTGGGWQDQVGGVTDGVKFITSNKGINQDIHVEQLNLTTKVKEELNERLCIIYTGQRRLARNLLRDVVGRYVGNIEESLNAHKQIQVVAQKMKQALLNEDVDEFARLLDYHWTLSKQIDEGSSNTMIENIFKAIEEYIDARMVIGAGGGGFVQVILKKGITKDMVQKRLKEVFGDMPIDVYESEIIY